MLIEGGNFRITDLADDKGIIRDLTARDAVFRGPAVLVAVERTNIDGCSWDTGIGSIEAILWDIPPEREIVIGAVGLHSCSFERCRFVNVGIAGPPDFIQRFLEATTA